jgi:hypothetical protein
MLKSKIQNPKSNFKKSNNDKIANLKIQKTFLPKWEFEGSPSSLKKQDLK